MSRKDKLIFEMEWITQDGKVKDVSRKPPKKRKSRNKRLSKQISKLDNEARQPTNVAVEQTSFQPS